MSRTTPHSPIVSPLGFFLQLSGMFALGVAQPLMQLVKENPEFLVVHHSRAQDLLVLVAVVFLLLPALLSALAFLVSRISGKSGSGIQALLMGALLTLTLLPVVEKIPVLGGWLTLAVAMSAGAVFAASYARKAALRENLSLLGIVVPVFIFLFLGSGPIREILFPAERPAAESAQETTDPVVVLVLDEFPLSSLLDDDHEIDPELYPNFRRLAGISTWYPNATTISPATLRSVPAILTGKFPHWQKTPTLENHPENIFTLLAASHHVAAFEAQTSLCPPELNGKSVPPPRERLSLLFEDLGILYSHIVVPAKWRDRLVPVADKWGNFRDSERGSGAPGAKPNRLEELEDFEASWSAGEKPLLAVAHVLLPHPPFHFLPDGTVYNRREKVPVEADGTWGPDKVMMADSYRRHLLQVVAVDREIGHLLDRLEELGILEKTAVVVTADHGASFRTGVQRRRFQAGNEADIMCVPLFIKLPGQMEGRVDGRWAQTVDIMPTLVAALGCRTDWKFDGRNLLADRPDRTRLDFLDQDQREALKIDPHLMAAKDDAIRWKDELFGREGGYERFFTMFDPGGFLGTNLSDLQVRPHPTLRGRINEELELEDVDLQGPYLPAEINGTLRGHDGPDRLTLALALNGKLAGFTRTYLAGSSDGALAWQFTVPRSAFGPGKNRADLLLVVREDGEFRFSRIPLFTPSFLDQNLGGRPVTGIRENGVFKPHDWNGVWARWTDGEGRWEIPLKPEENPRLLTLGIVWSGPPGRELEVVVNGVTLLKQFLPEGKWETRLPLNTVETGDRLKVELKSSVFIPAEVDPKSRDHRELGVAVSRLVVH